ncbi:MAG: radical SAM protein [Candidatus Omnitrophica bacterium]|nr:radical SAM protein [Candidatus Omnitrophota bacterium]
MIPLHNIRRFLSKSVQQPLYAAGVLKKRLKAYFYYLYGNGRSSYPESVTLFLTHRCNLKCRMCGQWGREGVTKKHDAGYINSEIRVKDMEKIIDSLAAFRPNITLFGGEPLLYRGLARIIKYIKGKGVHCLLITNGSMIEESARDIVESGLDELNVSLDGGKELHDEIRGHSGLFEKIVRGLEKVRRIKAEMNKKKPIVNLQCTITKYNYRHLEQLPAAAERIGADSLTFHNLIFLDDAILEKQKEFDGALGSASADWEGFKFLPDIDPEALHDKITKILSAKHKFTIDLYPNLSREALIDYYTKVGYAGPGSLSRCYSPWVTAYVFPDGEVRPCLNSTYSYGNILTDKFSDIWNNEKAVKFRRFLKKNRIFPVCVRCTELYRY